MKRSIHSPIATWTALVLGIALSLQAGARTHDEGVDQATQAAGIDDTGDGVGDEGDAGDVDPDDIEPGDVDTNDTGDTGDADDTGNTDDVVPSDAATDATQDADPAQSDLDDTAAPQPSARRQFEQKAKHTLLGLLMPELERRVRKAIGGQDTGDDTDLATDPDLR